MADEIEDTVDRAIPHFHVREVKNNYRSKHEGRPVYENKEYVEIIVPGNATERPCMPVRQDHIDRWPNAYKKFKSNQEQRAEGTPLDHWPHLQGDPARIRSLKDVEITTVDQLADLPDGFANSVGPDFNTLKKKAQQFLNTAEDNSQYVQSLERRIHELEQSGSAPESANGDLEQRVAELEAENERLRANQKKKPGRKPKSEQAETT